MVALTSDRLALARVFVAVLSDVYRWGEQDELIKRLQNHTLQCDAVMFSVAFEEGFDQGLFYFPAAVAYATSQYSDSSDVAKALVTFVIDWRDSMEKHGLYKLASDHVIQVVLALAEVFNSQRCDDFNGRCDKCQVAELDEILDAVCVRERHRHKRLLDDILDSWLQIVHSPACSANALALFARFRKTKYGYLIYRDDRLRKYAFDQSIVDRHLNCARQLIANTCSEAQVLEVSTWFTPLS